jgi:hypothetical protein
MGRRFPCCFAGDRGSDGSSARYGHGQNRQRGKPASGPRVEGSDGKYDPGQFAEVAVRLEKLISRYLKTLSLANRGLVYSVPSRDAKANPHLEKAVLLKPDSAAAIPWRSVENLKPYSMISARWTAYEVLRRARSPTLLDCFTTAR